MKSEKYRLHCSLKYKLVFYNFSLFIFHLFFHLTFCYKKTNMTPTNWRIGKHYVHSLHHHHLTRQRQADA